MAACTGLAPASHRQLCWPYRSAMHLLLLICQFPPVRDVCQCVDPLFNCIAGDVLQVRRGGISDGLPPRLRGRHGHVPLTDMVGLLQGWPPCHRGAPLPRTHPPSRTVPAYSPSRVPDALSTCIPELTFFDPSGPVSSEVFAISKCKESDAR
jgi:hypothetical protein